MADEEAVAAAPPPAHTNGTANGGGGDSDDEDPSKLRPVNIEQDMREMDRRKRVEAIMNSKLFREELERVVTDSLTDSGADGMSNMLADMMKVRGGAGGGAAMGELDWGLLVIRVGTRVA